LPLKRRPKEFPQKSKESRHSENNHERETYSKERVEPKKVEGITLRDVAVMKPCLKIIRK